MKRFIIAIFMALSIAAAAQPTQRQKMVHMAAVRIAEQIEVPDSSKEAFISLYQTYKKESAVIMAVRPAEDDTADPSEAKILCDFNKSEKLLALRREYYFKFRELLTPAQIQKMYDAERQSAKK